MWRREGARLGLQDLDCALEKGQGILRYGWDQSPRSHVSVIPLRYGQLSGMVEPLAGIFGAFAVVLVEPLLPYALAFAAGAMVYVVVDDIIPEAQIRWVKPPVLGGRHPLSSQATQFSASEPPCPLPHHILSVLSADRMKGRRANGWVT